jgi:ribose/xylose/arabinose/galactoside ABC-type transport system permease subunit
MSRSRAVARVVQGQGLFVMLVLIVVVFATQSGVFLTWDNFFTIGGAAAPLGIMAISQTYVIIAGGFDVSVGAVVAMSGVIIAELAGVGVDPWLGIAAGVVCGLLIGFANGLLVLQLKVNALIATLGTMSIVSGLAYVIIPTNEIINSRSASFAFLGNGYVGPVPFSMILMVVVAVVALVFERWTVVGRRVYAIGGNVEAARLSGVRVKSIPWVLYAVSGASGGLAGAIITSQLSSASPSVGSDYLLSVVTAVILGGASLAGGSGSVVGTIIAVAILGTLDGGFALLGFQSYIQTMALGAALIIAVLLQRASQIAGARGTRPTPTTSTTVVPSDSDADGGEG